MVKGRRSFALGTGCEESGSRILEFAANVSGNEGEPDYEMFVMKFSDLGDTDRSKREFVLGMNAKDTFREIIDNYLSRGCIDANDVIIVGDTIKVKMPVYVSDNSPHAMLFRRAFTEANTFARNRKEKQERERRIQQRGFTCQPMVAAI